MGLRSGFVFPLLRLLLLLSFSFGQSGTGVGLAAVGLVSHLESSLPPHSETLSRPGPVGHQWSLR